MTRTLDATTDQTLTLLRTIRKLMEGEEGEFAKIGEIRKDWQKSDLPLPWTDSPDVVRPN